MGAVKLASHPGGSRNTADHFMRQKQAKWQLAHMQTLPYLTFTCTCMLFICHQGGCDGVFVGESPTGLSHL